MVKWDIVWPDIDYQIVQVHFFREYGNGKKPGVIYCKKDRDFPEKGTKSHKPRTGIQHIPDAEIECRAKPVEKQDEKDIMLVMHKRTVAVKVKEHDKDCGNQCADPYLKRPLVIAAGKLQSGMGKEKGS